MSSFTITTPAAEITLSPSKVKRKETAKGTVTYTVTNTSGVTVRTALRVKPGAGADPGWFTVRGGEEREIRPGATEDFAVDISVPGQRVEGESDDDRPRLSFHAVAVNLNDPDNDTEAGSMVAFRAPILDTGRGIKWWMIAAPAALVILVVAAIFAIPRLFGPDETVLLADFRDRPLAEAREALMEQGLVVEEVQQPGQEPTQVAERFYDQIVDDQDPRSDGTLMVEPGSRVRLMWVWRARKVTVPDVSGKGLEEAIRLLEQNGLRYLAAEPPREAAPSPMHFLVVDRANRTGEVDAGTGIILTMRWQQPTIVLPVDRIRELNEQFQRLRNQQSPEFLVPRR